MRWILFILFCLLGAPAHAVSIPGVTTTTTTDSTTEPAPEPDIEQKKAAYGALADVLDNDTSRKELIDQLRTVAATPPAEPVPKIVPPTLVEEQTVLQKVTEVSRHYGEALSARFGQLYRNITGSPHKPFNPQTFSNALTHFSMLAVLVFGFYWLIRLCALPLYRKMGQWARQKNRERSNWLQLPAMIIGAFIIDLLLLALTLFVGQVLSDNLNAGSRTIAFQQSLFLNAFATAAEIPAAADAAASKTLPLSSAGRSPVFTAGSAFEFLPKRGGAAPVHDSGRERPLLESSPELVKQFDRLWPDCGRADYL